MKFISMANLILTTSCEVDTAVVLIYYCAKKRHERLGDSPKATPLSQDLNTDGLISEPEPLFYICTPKNRSQATKG